MPDTQEITEFDLSLLESLDFEPEYKCESRTCPLANTRVHPGNWFWTNRCTCAEGLIVCTSRKNMEHQEIERQLRMFGRVAPCAACGMPVNPSSTFLPLKDGV